MGLLGSGSKGRSNSMNRAAGAGAKKPDAADSTPQIDSVRFEQATRAGFAGKMLHNVLQKSRSIGIRP